MTKDYSGLLGDFRFFLRGGMDTFGVRIPFGEKLKLPNYFGGEGE